MEQLDLLWQYQEFDLVLDQYDQERKNHPLRHTLLKLKNYLMDQQSQLMKLDEEADRRQQKFVRLQKEYELLATQLEEEKRKVAVGEFTAMQQIEQLEKDGKALRDKAARIEEELKRLMREMETMAKKIEDIGHKMAKSKKEYSEVKESYDAAVKKIMAEYNKVKTQRDQFAANLDKALLIKYNNIRTTRTPVISTILQDRCGGCNMSMASLVIQKVKDKKRVVDCENCGRILFYGQ